MAREKSCIAWRGVSRIDGKTPIVLVLTGLGSARLKGANSKTGPMVQSYILVSGIHPTDAIRSGADRAICGDCRHRRQPDGRRTCYVNPATGLGSVGRAMLKGDYPEVPLRDAAEMVRGRDLRIGTYGDPAAVPFEVWASLIAFAAGWTGYTHQWDAPGADVRLQGIVMASVDSLAEYARAKDTAWRTFRVLAADGSDTPGAREISCPASAEVGKVTTCDACQLCTGRTSRAKDVAIVDHSTSGRAAVRRAAGLHVVA